ncbi:MAG: hypothetical protein LQ348_003380 [Seirophora lacunosa]|nr:MAG: hypothetical protein LQ348_003380 [Seirophora lacunosa]
MSRKIYMQQLEDEARHQARNARLAFADAGMGPPTNPRPLQHVLMEILEEGKAVLDKLWETALVPFHAAVSKPAQKAYLGTFLLATTSLFLLALSTVAYGLFYYNFVPQVSVERTVHLQFGNGHPHGTATFGYSLASLQPYDVSILLHLPRTPNNLATGNFMLDLSLLAAPGSPSVPKIPTPTVSAAGMQGSTQRKLAHSRRPAILTYASLITDTASTLGGLPWHMLGWKTESEVLEVAMFEGLEFSRGSGNVAQELELVVEADEKMQFYEVGIRIVARFGGLRWIMYYHRILSYVIFTSLFWTSSMISALIAWLVLASYFPSGSTLVKKEESTPSAIKTEPSETEPSVTEGLSDTSRTFPTLTRHMPLHFTSGEGSGRFEEMMKEEEDVLQSTGVQPLIAEADDEAEGAETSGFRDSGIGTSLEEDRRAQLQKRRKALPSNRD